MNANIFHGMTQGVSFDQVMWDNNSGSGKERSMDRFIYRPRTVLFDKSSNIWRIK